MMSVSFDGAKIQHSEIVLADIGRHWQTLADIGEHWRTLADIGGHRSLSLRQ
ncbi:MAG: hypothetical protein K2H97_00530 [Prevotella sp.]|nr:hypothetical protein [Prevotella sp.]